MRSSRFRFISTHQAARGLLLALLLGVTLPSPAAESASETAVKTAFLYNFFKFIDWPAETTSGEMLRLCVVGEPEMEAGLGLLRNKSVGGKSLRVEVDPGIAEVRQCQILYIGRQVNAGDYLRAVKDQPVVTVSDQHGFIDHGGVIGFVPVDNRLGFEINNDAANRNRLHINAQLLKLAQRVEMEK